MHRNCIENVGQEGKREKRKIPEVCPESKVQLSNVQGPMSKVQKGCAECILAEGRERKE